jgi:hypothetical protein
MSNNSSSSSNGISFAGLLTIVFITLKLCGVIHWFWLWVLSPLWISASIVVGILLISGLVMLGAWLIATILDRPKKRRGR